MKYLYIVIIFAIIIILGLLFWFLTKKGKSTSSNSLQSLNKNCKENDFVPCSEDSQCADYVKACGEVDSGSVCIRGKPGPQDPRDETNPKSCKLKFGQKDHKDKYYVTYDGIDVLVDETGRYTPDPFGDIPQGEGYWGKHMDSQENGIYCKWFSQPVSMFDSIFSPENSKEDCVKKSANEIKGIREKEKARKNRFSKECTINDHDQFLCVDSECVPWRYVANKDQWDEELWNWNPEIFENAGATSYNRCRNVCKNQENSVYTKGKLYPEGALAKDVFSKNIPNALARVDKCRDKWSKADRW